MKVKYTPRIIVTDKASNELEWFFIIREWWAQVTLTPEESKIIVFIKGTLKGLKATKPIGGQMQPNSTLGERLLWKKAQKNEKKNITSETSSRN